MTKKLNFAGVSAFAGPSNKFPIKRFLRQFPDDIKAPATAILPGTFGWSTKFLGAFVEKFKDRPFLVEVHISNGPGRRRPGWLKKGSFAYQWSVAEFNKDLEARSPKLKRVLKKHMEQIEETVFSILAGQKNAHLAICPELEDNLTDKAYLVLKSWIDEMLSGTTEGPDGPISWSWKTSIKIIFVRNPCMKGKGVPNKTKYERHGIVYNMDHHQMGNMDGVTVNFGDRTDRYLKQASLATVKRYIDTNQNAFAVMIWSANQQGLGGATTYSKYPPVVEREYIVTENAIKHSLELLKGR